MQSTVLFREYQRYECHLYRILLQNSLEVTWKFTSISASNAKFGVKVCKSCYYYYQCYSDQGCDLRLLLVWDTCKESSDSHWGEILPPRGYLVMSGDIFGCHKIEVRDAAKHPMVTKQTLLTEQPSRKCQQCRGGEALKERKNRIKPTSMGIRERLNIAKSEVGMN